jgi:hypothetical protein
MRVEAQAEFAIVAEAAADIGGALEDAMLSVHPTVVTRVSGRVLGALELTD